jgi:hypothetical protein
MSIREARAAIRRLEVYEGTHDRLRDGDRLDVLVSLVLSRRSEGVTRILDNFSSWDSQQECRSRLNTWDDQLRAVEAPRHRLLKPTLEAWEARPL